MNTDEMVMSNSTLLSHLKKPPALLQLNHLDQLESESIYIIREIMAEARNPVMLYSIGKDSSVLLHLARKAFWPGKVPFPLLHVDTNWKFKDMTQFRDAYTKAHDLELIVHKNSHDTATPFTHNASLYTEIMKTQALKQAMESYGFDAAFGGARRDEEKSRAKERILSFRNQHHQWDPKQQRPEIWNLFNTFKNNNESFRVFPLSNWTELDIWLYIYREAIPIVPLYLAENRPVVTRQGSITMIDDQRFILNPGEQPTIKKIRFRTLGCYPLTAAVESDADSIEKVIMEMFTVTTSERQGRLIDQDHMDSMEQKKKEGYF